LRIDRRTPTLSWKETMTKSPVHAFLDGSGRDSRGRLIETVLAFDDAQIEATHDFIQWLFPLPVPSTAQPQSPVLSTQDLAAIAADPVAIANLTRARVRMAAFYATNDHWLVWHNHNHLRLTRILKSLRLLAGLDEAKRFYTSTVERAKASSNEISPRSLYFWLKAVE
jgi:Opioid growth factor receptor (OGFr) conserved region